VSSNSSGVAGRYAAALFEIAEERKQLDEVATDTSTIRAWIGESSDLRRLVASPVIARDDQRRALAALLAKASMSELTSNFVGVVAQNRRLFVLENMCAAFHSLLAKSRGEISAEVTTVLPLSEKQQQALTEELRKSIGSRVVLNTKIDHTLLGGMVVKVGSRMIDSSLKTKLQRLEFSLKGTA
jgi:F-type H+-transporting ATPase subunit delta